MAKVAGERAPTVERIMCGSFSPGNRSWKRLNVRIWGFGLCFHLAIAKYVMRRRVPLADANISLRRCWRDQQRVTPGYLSENSDPGPLRLFAG
jgi:hypothetical protein